MADETRKATVEINVNGQQATQELERLKKTAALFRDEMAKAMASGDDKKIKELKKLMRENEAETRKFKLAMFDVDKVLKNLSTAGPKELQKTLRSLNLELNSGRVARGSKEWDALQNKIKLVNAELRKVKAESQEATSWLSRLGDGFNRFAALGASVIASAVGIKMSMQKAVQAYADMQEAQAQVQKYTGMSKEAVNDLNEELKKMDTRTPREKLNALAADAGRLGITGKEAILEFVDAGDKINVGLGEDLGEDAVKNIGKLAQMFGEDKTKGLRGAMLATGSAINEVAQNSSADEKYLVDFTARVGGAANQMRISQADILGFGSVLDQNMKQVEMSGTAFQNVLVKMYQDPAKFAKIAGLDVKKFTNLLKNDANEAFLTLMDSLNKRGGMDQLAPIFDKMNLDGARAVDVLSVLAKNVAQVRIEQGRANKAYNDATSLQKEFSIQNETEQAQLDKAKKRINDVAVELGEKLMPITRHLMSSGTAMLKVLSAIISVMFKYRNTIIAVSIVAAGYVTILYAQIVAQKLLDFWNKQVISSLKKLYLVISTNPWMAAIAGIGVLVGLYMDLNREATSAEKTQKLLNKIQGEASTSIAAEKSNLQSLLSVAKNEKLSKGERAVAIKKLNELSPEYLGNLSLENLKTKDADLAVQKYTQSLILNAKAKAISSAIEENEKKKQDLKTNPDTSRWYDPYLSGLNEIGDKAERVRNAVSTIFSQGDVDGWYEKTSFSGKAMNSMDAALGRYKTTMKGYTDESQVLNNELSKITQEQIKLSFVDRKKKKPDTGGGVGLTEEEKKKALEEAEKARKKALEEAERDSLKDQVKIKTKYAAGLIDKEQYDNEMLKSEKNLLDAKMKIYAADSKEYQQLLGQKLDMDIQANQKNTADTLEELEKRTAEEKNILLDAYASGKINKKAYDQGLFELELNALKKKKETYKKDSKEYAKLDLEIQTKLLNDKFEKRKDFEEKIKDLQEKYASKTAIQLQAEDLQPWLELLQEKKISFEDFCKAEQLIREKYADQVVDEAGTTKIDGSAKSTKELEKVSAFDKLKAEHEKINELEETGALTHQQALDKKAQADGKYAEKLSQTMQAAYAIIDGLMSSYSEYSNASQDLEVAKVESKYDKEIKAAGNNSTKVAELEAEKEKEVAKVKSKANEKAMKIEVAQAIASTAMSAINAYSSAASVPLIGYILAPIAAAAAVASGMMQVAAIKKQHQAEALGYASGGFTPSGRWDQEVGTVHAGEFVANHKAVQNSDILPVLRLIDMAQRNNTIGSLTARDVSNVLGISSGVGAGGGNFTSGTSSAGGSDQAMQAVGLEVVAGAVGNMVAVVKRLNDKLDEGIDAYTTIDGPDGFDRKYKRYQKLISNKSRS